MILTWFEGGEYDTVPTDRSDFAWENLEPTYRGLAERGRGKEKSTQGFAIAAQLRGLTTPDITALLARREKWTPTPQELVDVRQYGYRADAFVETVSCLVIDYDGCPTTPPDWRPESWHGIEIFAHSSHSWHPMSAPGRWRVFLRLAEPIPGAWYKRAARQVQKLLPKGAILRTAATQPAFLPTCPAELETQFISVHGTPLRITEASLGPERKAPAKCRVVLQPGEETAYGRLVATEAGQRQVLSVIDALAKVSPQSGEGGGHAIALAIGGILANAHMTTDEAVDFVAAWFDTIGAPDQSVEVAMSLEKRRHEEAVTKGWPSLRSELERVASGIDVAVALQKLGRVIPGLGAQK